MFVKELKMYVDYLRNEINTISEDLSAKQVKKWNTFKSNLFTGIAYYQELFVTVTSSEYEMIQKQLQHYKEELVAVSIPELKLV
jgi:hypothetical protein